jgi:hypothetical protein
MTDITSCRLHLKATGVLKSDLITDWCANDECTCTSNPQDDDIRGGVVHKDSASPGNRIITKKV